jgi:hypothetical protein
MCDVTRQDATRRTPAMQHDAMRRDGTDYAASSVMPRDAMRRTPATLHDATQRVATDNAATDNAATDDTAPIVTRDTM